MELIDNQQCHTFIFNLPNTTMKNLLILLIGVLLVMPDYSNAQCTNPNGDVITGSLSNYNCHQYVRAALINNWVNLDDGTPNPIHESSIQGTVATGPIETDDNFIRVCSNEHAKAISTVGFSHSAIVRTGGFVTNDLGYFASTPNTGSQVYRQGHARSFTPSCTHKLYSTTTGITISGPSSINLNATQVYTVVGLPSYATVSWQPLPGSLQLISSTATSITVKGIGSGSGSIQLKLNTSCMDGTDHRPIKSKAVTVMADCGGTLNGGSLYTFNTVGAGSANQVIMNASSWTWVKTSGNTSYWYTTSGGKNLFFAVPSGCATFNAYGSGCNLTMTFCAYGGYMMAQEPATQSIDYKVLDIQSSKVVKEGTLSSSTDSDDPMAGLPAGFYVLVMNGQRKKMVIK